MTTQKQAADILERLAELEAREAERERAAEQERRVRELEQERKGPSAKRVTAEGVGTGTIQCISEDCPKLFQREPVELTFTTTTLYQKDASGHVTDRPESDWTHWHLQDASQSACPECGDPRNIMAPDAKSVWDGTRRKHDSELQGLRKLRNAEIQRVEVVTPEVTNG
jgi:hypothetical protein